MKALFLISLILFSISELLAQNKYNVLYLNSGTGQYKIEQNIYNGIYSNINESTNITLFRENLSLYSNKSENYLKAMTDLISIKYGKINIDLIIVLNYDALEFVLDNIYQEFNEPFISYGEIIQPDKSLEINKKYNFTGLYSSNYLEETVNLIQKHNQNPQISLILSPWELKFFNTSDLDKLSIVYDLKSIEDLLDRPNNNTIFITGAYTDPFIIKKMYDIKIYSYWDTYLENKLVGGFMQNGNLFGNRLAYKGKLLLLNIDLSPRIEEFPNYFRVVDFSRQELLGVDNLYDNIRYLNIPKNEFEKDIFLSWKIAFIITLTIFFITTLSIVIFTGKKRSRLIIETEQQLYSLINKLPLPIHARDEAGKYLFVNDKFLEVNYLKNRDDIINRTINNTPGLSPEEIQIFLKQDKDVLESNKVKVYETPFYDVKIKKNKLYKVYKNPLTFYGQDCVLCILDDITDLKNAEREVVELNKNLEEKIQSRTNDLEESLKKLNETQNELVETKKMASLTTLVVGIAHEMNTPLGIGLTQVTYLYDITKELKTNFDNENVKKSSLKKYIDLTLSSEELVLNSLRKTITMINRFKEIAIQRDDKVSKFNILDQIKQNMNIYLNSQGYNNIQLKVLADKDLTIITFREAFMKVLENLVDNSITHGKLSEGGEIIISCKKIHSSIEIDYIDDGSGIKDDYVDKIFDPFFTTNRSEGQIGLGLSIVFAIMKNKLNGSIKYFKPYNKSGAGFKITLKDFTI